MSPEKQIIPGAERSEDKVTKAMIVMLTGCLFNCLYKIFNFNVFIKVIDLTIVNRESEFSC